MWPPIEQTRIESSKLNLEYRPKAKLMGEVDILMENFTFRIKKNSKLEVSFKIK